MWEKTLCKTLGDYIMEKLSKEKKEKLISAGIIFLSSAFHVTDYPEEKRRIIRKMKRDLRRLITEIDKTLRGF